MVNLLPCCRWRNNSNCPGSKYRLLEALEMTPYLNQIANECKELAERIERMEPSKINLKEAIQALCFKVGSMATYLEGTRPAPARPRKARQ
jgi:hypothetical protein